MYTKKDIGQGLKQQLLQKKTAEEIGAWAVAEYYENVLNIDSESDIRSFLLHLGTMEEGQQFEYTYEELNNIADRLIAGEDVKL